MSHQNNCTSCLFGKLTRLSLSLIETISDHPLDLLFSDVWSPYSMHSINSHKYFVIFVDDYSKFTWLFPIIKKKIRCSKSIVQFQYMVDAN